MARTEEQREDNDVFKLDISQHGQNLYRQKSDAEIPEIPLKRLEGLRAIIACHTAFEDQVS